MAQCHRSYELRQRTCRDRMLKEERHRTIRRSVPPLQAAGEPLQACRGSVRTAERQPLLPHRSDRHLPATQGRSHAEKAAEAQLTPTAQKNDAFSLRKCVVLFIFRYSIDAIRSPVSFTRQAASFLAASGSISLRWAAIIASRAASSFRSWCSLSVISSMLRA